MSLGKYPDRMKLAKVIPIYKNEDDTEPGNYRPISLLSVYNRIFEKIMYNRVTAFLEKYNILSPSQYGFRSCHSTQHAILDITSKILQNMNNKLYTCGIFLDLKKAFDTIDHTILLNKLAHYGIRGTVNSWFSSYLTNRFQTTVVNDYASRKQECCYGVPQGSVLGPVLFLLYINDISCSSSKFSFHLFADDTNVLYANKNPQTLEKVVNTELANVSDWLIANKLTVNTKKSSYVIFRSFKKPLPFAPRVKMYDPINQIFAPLNLNESVKYLGVLMDEHLSWKHHIEYVTLKISRSIGIISKIRHYVPLSTRLTLYQSLVHPYLTYGISAWGGAASIYLNSIRVLQKRALRLIYFAKFNEHAIPLFLQANILPLDLLYFHVVSDVMYDVSSGAAPYNIANLFKKVTAMHSYGTRSATSNKFYIQQSSLEILKKSFSRRGTDIWNSIPLKIRGSVKRASKPGFRRGLKDLLMGLLASEDQYLNVANIIKTLNKVT